MLEKQLTIMSSKQHDLLLSYTHCERGHSLMLVCFRDSIHGGSISQSFYEYITCYPHLGKIYFCFLRQSANNRDILSIFALCYKAKQR